MNFMKKLIAIFVVLSLVSCYKTFSNKQNFDKIEMNNVEKILIKKQLYDTLCVEFNQKENIKFIELINSSKKLEVRKAIPEYWVFVKFKNGDERSFKIIDNFIGEYDEYKKVNKILPYYQSLYIGGLKIKCK